MGEFFLVFPVVCCTMSPLRVAVSLHILVAMAGTCCGRSVSLYFFKNQFEFIFI